MKTFDLTRASSNEALLAIALRPRNEKKKFFRLRRVWRHVEEKAIHAKEISFLCLTGVPLNKFNLNKKKGNR